MNTRKNRLRLLKQDDENKQKIKVTHHPNNQKDKLMEEPEEKQRNHTKLKTRKHE